VLRPFNRLCSPPGNGFVEILNGRLHDECLNEHSFTSHDKGLEAIEAWCTNLQCQVVLHEPQWHRTNGVCNPVRQDRKRSKLQP